LSAVGANKGLRDMRVVDAVYASARAGGQRIELARE